MKTTTPILAAAAAFLTLAAFDPTQTAAAADAPPTQMAKQFEFDKKLSLHADYLLFLPAGYEKQPDNRWPLMMFLHGSGERGTNVWLVAKHGPPKEITAHPDFPFIVVSPQCPEGQIWSDDVVMALLDEIEQNYRVDLTRVYLTGLSMGGYGAWSLGVAHPERFAAIVPICGGGNLISLLLSSPAQAEALRTMGIWAFHGAKDPVVPVHESERMVEAMKRLGVKEAKLTIYPEAQHDCWTETYRNPELYEWLLKHERTAPKE